MKTLRSHIRRLAVYAVATTALLGPLIHTDAAILMGAGVSVGQASWGDFGECPDVMTYPDPKDIPVLRSKCASIEGDASAYAQHLSTCCDPCVIVHEDSFGSLSADPGGTGCKIEITGMHFRISCPKHDGTVKITATVSGDTQCCDSNTPPCLCPINSQTWTAVGSVQVQLPPADEDCDGGSCNQDDDNSSGGSCSAPPGGGGGPSSCGSCGGGNSDGPPSFASALVRNNSANFRLYLGRSTARSDAGYIYVKADQPSAALSTPTWLTNAFPRSGVTIVTDGSGAIKQVKAPDGLVNVTQQAGDNYGYQLDCYYAAYVSGPSGGPYTFSGSPFCSWVVTNLDRAAANNRLMIKELRDGQQRQFLFTYTATSNQWDLLQPDGLTLMRKWQERDTSDGTGATTNIYYDSKYNGALVRHTQRTYQWISAINDRVLTKWIDGDSSTPQTTLYDHYPPNATTGANLVRRIDFPDGHWVYYDYDSQGRLTRKYASYGSVAPPSSGEPDPTSGCLVVDYSYTVSGISDNSGVKPWSPRLTVSQVAVGGTLYGVLSHLSFLFDERCRQHHRAHPNSATARRLVERQRWLRRQHHDQKPRRDRPLVLPP